MKKIKKANQIKGMVDTSSKSVTKRRAIASATVNMNKKTFLALINNESPKGNVLEAARIAGITAAKKTPYLIPMCHPLEINSAKIDITLNQKKHTVIVTSEVVYEGRTGVEMEALTAVTVAALTVYDMMKWAQKGMIISDVMLMSKTGGKSGVYTRG